MIASNLLRQAQACDLHGLNRNILYIFMFLLGYKQLFDYPSRIVVEQISLN
jgi:hypothetical protein